MAPQHQRLWPVWMPQVKKQPAAAAAQVVPVATWAGVGESTLLPMPSPPNELSPQHHKLWSVRIAQVWYWRAATTVQVVPAATAVGAGLLVVVPSPSDPLSLGV